MNAKYCIKNILETRRSRKHDAIVKAALKLFLEGAYETTSMDQIAKLADVSKQTIYSNFGSKETLFSAVMDSKCGKAKEDSFKSLCPENSEGKEPKELIAGVVNEFYRMLISDESISLYRTVIAESPRNKELGVTFLETGPEQVFAGLEEYFKREHKEKRLHIPNPRDAAEQIMFLTKDYQHLKALVDVDYKITEKHIKQHVKNVTDTFMQLYGI